MTRKGGKPPSLGIPSRAHSLRIHRPIGERNWQRGTAMVGALLMPDNILTLLSHPLPFRPKPASTETSRTTANAGSVAIKIQRKKCW